MKQKRNKMDKESKYSYESKKYWLLLGVFLVLILVPALIKILGSQTYLAEEVYYHERIIQQIRETDNLSQDIVQGQNIPLNIFYIILAYSFIDTSILIIIIPLLFATGSIFLIFKILKEFKIEEEIKQYALIVVALSPALLYSFIVFSPRNVQYFLSLLTIFLLIKDKKITPLFLILLLILNIPLGLAVLLMSYLLNSTTLKNKNIYNKKLIIYALIIIALIMVLDPTKIITDFVPSYAGFAEIFTEFGALEGYTIMILGLALIGAFAWWDKTKQKNIAILFLFALFATSLMYPSLKILTITIFSIFAGIAINYFIKREWRLEILKNTTILLIICSLIFSTVVFNVALIKNISSEKIIASTHLKTSEKGDIVLSSEKNGFMIQKVAQRKTYLDSRSYKAKDYGDKLAVVERIYYAKNLAELKQELDSNSIKYIFIDLEMKQNIWNNKEEGLMFFLVRSKEFIKVYENAEVEIYRYIKDIKMQ